MKKLRKASLAAAALALVALAGATSASATTLETTGVTTNASETITDSLEFGTSWSLSLTGGGFVNTCTSSHTHWKTTSPFTGSTIGGPVESMSFTNCTRPVTVHKPGSLSITHITGTTNATVRSANTEATVGSPIGTLTCTTPAAGTHLGVLTGVKHGHATIHMNAVLNCGFLAPSAVVPSVTYTITSPTGLGVSA